MSSRKVPLMPLLPCWIALRALKAVGMKNMADQDDPLNGPTPVYEVRLLRMICDAERNNVGCNAEKEELLFSSSRQKCGAPNANGAKVVTSLPLCLSSRIPLTPPARPRPSAQRRDLELQWIQAP
eukprot:CAMPEP_0170621048 /NCGR_PEP_ID=MMETSP0224-20130122/28393_1 /TAXON_ID=285029 /ORGANISM="Togula jolla, Strain CCCM 725" /LENGTH=124 /DNA_ID=CAMNT_0010947281 /DNA_START=11 /DNA_END=385 /DNA_ORIENTATION=-